MGDSSKLGKIFIGGLSYETTDEKLRSYFAAYGSVTDAVVMKDPISRRSRGFGFITYADALCVDRALAQATHILDNRRVEAKRAVPRAESARDLGSSSFNSTSSSMHSNSMSSSSLGLRTLSHSNVIPSSFSMHSYSNSNSIGATKKIFVGGLHYETKDADFKAYFMQFGTVVSAEVMFNRETNKSRGFGFVIFETESSVDAVLHELHHVIDGKSVEVKRAVPRTDVPPPRSVSSRAGSFSGTTGPGSVCSLDDVSVSSATLSIRSMPGTPSRSNVSLSSSAASASNANGPPLVGYAAAVRFGGRVSSKQPMHVPRSSSSGVASSSNSVNGERYSLDGVADALSSLSFGNNDSYANSITTPSISASSSLESPSKLLNGSHDLSPLAADPVIEQWNLSPASAPQPSRVSDVPFLSHNAPTSSNAPPLSWQTTPWDQAWPSLQQQQQHHHQPSHHHQHHHAHHQHAHHDARSIGSQQRSPTSPSFFPMFPPLDSPHGSVSSSSSLGPSAWSPPEYVGSNSNSNGGHSNGGHSMGNGFGHGGGGRFGSSNGGGGGLSGLRNDVSSSSDGSTNGGVHGNGSNSNASSSYASSLSGFLQPESYLLPQEEPELPLDTAFERIMGDSSNSAIDLDDTDGANFEKKQQLDFALPQPLQATTSQHRFR